VLTAWLKLIGKGAPEVPLLDVALTRSGTALVSVSARARPLPHLMRTPCMRSSTGVPS
jgi:hypothetical protein